MAEYGKKIIKMVDYEAMKKAFDEKFKETMQLMENGETHLDNLAEGFHEADGVIFRMPNADVAPVVHGRWIHNIIDYPQSGWIEHKCSICEHWQVTNQPTCEHLLYCPNCGAKMDGE